MSKILLVDLSAVYWRAYHATKDQQVNESFQITINTINAKRNAYDHCAVCCDHAPYLRKKIYPEYKSHRDTPDPIAVGQLQRVKDRLTLDGVLLWDAEGFESDDLIATACKKLTDNLGEESLLAIDILTADKDLYALISDRVTIVRLDNGERHGEDECIAKLGVHPSKVAELLALTGDKSDHIPGCPGIGPKKAAQLLTDNGSINQILNCMPDDLVATGATKDAIISNRAAIRQSLALVTLMTDAPIDIDALFDPVEQKPLTDIKDEEFEVEDQEPAQEQAPSAPEEKQTQAIEMVSQERTLTRVAAPSFELSLEPTTSGQAWALSKAIHSSRLFAVESPEQALMILMAGREMGIGAMASLRGFHFIKGRPCISAQLMAALIIRSGKAEYWELVESSSKSATYATKRVGGRNEQRKTFTVDDARLAQLVKTDSNWQKYPSAMCEARASSALARVVYPDLLMGVYLPDEMDAA